MEQVAVKFDGVVARVRGTVDQDAAYFTALAALLATVMVHALFWLFVGFTQPIADLHQFRQTQTAATAYWIWRGGPLLAYETPVLGYPWSVPFEFPLYQYLVVGLRLIGIPIAEGGRLVMFAFYLGLLWPLKILLKNLGLGRTDYFILSILLLSSPLYIYWSRTVMIESCALFFGLAWLAFLLQYMRTQAPRDAAIAIGFGILAITTKLTTFPGFGIIGGIAFLATAYRMYRDGLTERNLRFLLTVACIGLAPFASGLAWVAYTDHVKGLNALGTSLTSGALSTWNFGTLEQRFSVQFWQGIILGRIVPDVLGFGAIAGLIACGAALGSPRYVRLLGLSILSFFAPMLIFTNLHIEHNYYQYANGVFLLAAVGFGLSSLAHSGRRVLSALLLLMVVAGQLIYFNAGFARVISADYSGNREVQVGALAKSLTRSEDSLLILGDDWNSAIAYEAERKAITLPYWVPPATIAQIFDRPEGYLGGMKLGAIVYCSDQAQRYQANPQDLQRFLAGRAVLGQAGGCQIFSPQR
jgi:hypothetical protein